MCQVNGPSCSVQCTVCGKSFNEREDKCPHCARSLPISEDQLDALLKSVKPATKEELREQGENLAKNYRPGPRQAVPSKPVSEDGPAEGIETCRNCHTVGHTDWCRDGLDEPRPVEPAAPIQPKKYLDWTNAGGPNECAHGYAAGISCPNCENFAERASALQKRIDAKNRESFKASQPTPVVVPDEAEDLYFFEAGPDGTHSEVLPESKLKQAVHDSMCMCGMDWQSCESDGVTDTCEAIDDDSEWNSTSGIKRWSWGQDFEDGYIRIIRLLTAQPAPLPSGDKNTFEEVLINRAGEYRDMEREHRRYEEHEAACTCSDKASGIHVALKLFRLWNASKEPPALPVGQNETFEEWRRSPEACAIFAEYAPGFAAPMIKAARAAWNAVKGQKDMK